MKQFLPNHEYICIQHLMERVHLLMLICVKVNKHEMIYNSQILYLDMACAKLLCI